jgi:hypothetical protein
MTLGLSSGGANNVIVSDARLIGLLVPVSEVGLIFFAAKRVRIENADNILSSLSALKGDIRRPTCIGV